jgi:hypothetical protein
MTSRTARGAAIVAAAALLAGGAAAAIGLAGGGPAAPAAPTAPATATSPPAASGAPATPGVSAARDGARGRMFPKLVPAPAPSGWRHLTLPDGTAVLSYPPGMRRIGGDDDALSAAKRSPGGRFLLYLNATPRQGDESLRNWVSFRLRLLRADDAARARLVAAVSGQRFRGGAGSCVIDDYVTRIHSNHFTELACLVRGLAGVSVIVAAAPTARWSAAEPILGRAVSAYLVH